MLYFVQRNYKVPKVEKSKVQLEGYADIIN